VTSTLSWKGKHTLLNMFLGVRCPHYFLVALPAACQVFFYTENHVNSIATAPAFVEVAHK
jgi:hypothetical protein